MAELVEIEKGDVIATKDGKEIRIERIYKPAGTIVRVEGIDVNDASPMMTPVFANNIARVLRKRIKPVSPAAPASLPDGQVVKEKTPVTPVLEKDIKEREHYKVSSAKENEGGKK